MSALLREDGYVQSLETQQRAASTVCGSALDLTISTRTTVVGRVSAEGVRVYGSGIQEPGVDASALACPVQKMFNSVLFASADSESSPPVAYLQSLIIEPLALAAFVRREPLPGKSRKILRSLVHAV